MIHFFKLIRFPNLLIIVFVQYVMRWLLIAPILKQLGLKLQLGESLFALLCLSTVLIASAGYIINDYFDIKIDRVNKAEKIIVGKYISRRQAMFLHLLFSGIALLIAFYVNWKVGDLKLFTLQIIAVSILWYYSISFKYKLLIGNILIAILAAIIPLMAGYYEVVLLMKNSYIIIPLDAFTTEWEHQQAILQYKEMLNKIGLWIIGYGGFAFIYTVIREIIKDIEDMKGDAQYKCKTLPILYGIDSAKKVIYLIGLLAISILILVEWLFLKSLYARIYIVVGIQLMTIYLLFKVWTAKEKEQFHDASTLSKIIMLIGTLLIPFLYYLGEL